jgi:hypothetical protein
MTHAKDSCPFYPKEDPAKFDTQRLYMEYRGQCRDCGNEWNMIIQDEYTFLKETVDDKKSKYYGYIRSKQLGRS